ncbi:MAG TPA: hypothetical protein VHV08_16610 [Pirellulales bacterium]|nr:hypothetical protein [Pirellulales bacterium]
MSFVLGTGQNVISGINWWGSYEFLSPPPTPGVDQFAITISTTAYDSYDNVYEPGAVVATVNSLNLGRTPTSLFDDQGNRIYAYSTPITPITLTAGVTYMLDFANNTGLQNYSWQYLTSSGSSLGAYLNYGSDDGHWNTTTPMAFNLTDNAINTPEPSGMALLLTAAATCLLGRRVAGRGADKSYFQSSGAVWRAFGRSAGARAACWLP